MSASWQPSIHFCSSTIHTETNHAAHDHDSHINISIFGRTLPSSPESALPPPPPARPPPTSSSFSSPPESRPPPPTPTPVYGRRPLNTPQCGLAPNRLKKVARKLRWRKRHDFSRVPEPPCTWYANDLNLVRDVGCGDGDGDSRGGGSGGGGGGDSGFLARSRAKRAFSSLSIFQHARTGFGFKWGAATPPGRQPASQPAIQWLLRTEVGRQAGELIQNARSTHSVLPPLT